MCTEKTNNLVFSASPLEIFFGRYSGFLGSIIMCTIFVATYFDNDNLDYPLEMFVILALLTLLFYFPHLLARKFAYKMHFDLNKSEVTFFMFFPSLGKRTITFRINNIQDISINFYITFISDSEKVLFRGLENKKLISFLEGLKPVSWGYWGRKVRQGKWWA